MWLVGSTWMRLRRWREVVTPAKVEKVRVHAAVTILQAGIGDRGFDAVGHRSITATRFVAHSAAAEQATNVEFSVVAGERASSASSAGSCMQTEMFLFSRLSSTSSPAPLSLRRREQTVPCSPAFNATEEADHHRLSCGRQCGKTQHFSVPIPQA